MALKFAFVNALVRHYEAATEGEVVDVSDVEAPEAADSSDDDAP